MVWGGDCGMVGDEVGVCLEGCGVEGVYEGVVDGGCVHGGGGVLGVWDGRYWVESV